MPPVLTIATAAYRAFDETYFTLEALRTYHGADFELLVVDNAPESCKRTVATTRAVRGRYVHRPDLHGTSAPRDAAFHLAMTPWVMVIDNHVLLEPGAVAAAIEYATNNPDSRDIVSGPLVGDDGVWSASHWKPDAPGCLWGAWAGPKALGLPDTRLSDPEPFEIPMMGLGLWMMRRAAWPGFNPRFRGFGGEEGYVHEKVRRLGGKALCLPKLRWRHKFRDVGGWEANPVPYPLRTSDHVWNLLVGQRELGVDKTEMIWDHFGKKLGKQEAFDALVAGAAAAQPEGVLSVPVRKKILGVWYSNNAAPAKLLNSSLQSIKVAAGQSRHDVTVVTCPWEHVQGNPFKEVLAAEKTGNHLGIVRQIKQCLAAAGDGPWDAVVFLEHDVLYAGGHFDRVMKAFELKPTAEVVSCLDYEGLNATGWLSVVERHEPFHQLAMRHATAVANLARAEVDCQKQGWAYLEPQGDRSGWAQVKPEGLCPNVHVNHAKRFTSHGEVCYQKTSADAAGNPRLAHPYWGKAADWWPEETAVSEPKKGGCGCGSGVKSAEAKARAVAAEPATAAEWYAQDLDTPAPDFHEHMETLTALAASCTHATELSAWPKPAYLALAAGLPADGVLVSLSGRAKGWWPKMVRKLGERFVRMKVADPMAAEVEIPETDLLFIDTAHTAERVHAELTKFHTKVRKYIVIHTVQTFGFKGDDGGPGVLAGMNRFLREHQGWVVKDYYENNHGLVVLSNDPADKPAIKHGVRDAVKFFKASLTRAVQGNTYLPLEMANERIDACLSCPQRGGDEGGNCKVCRCFLFQLPEHIPVKGGGPGKVFYPSETCPISKWGPRPDDGVKMTGEEAAAMLKEAFGPGDET